MGTKLLVPCYQDSAGNKLCSLWRGIFPSAGVGGRGFNNRLLWHATVTGIFADVHHPTAAEIAAPAVNGEWYAAYGVKPANANNWAGAKYDPAVWATLTPDDNVRPQYVSSGSGLATAAGGDVAVNALGVNRRTFGTGEYLDNDSTAYKSTGGAFYDWEWLAGWASPPAIAPTTTRPSTWWVVIECNDARPAHYHSIMRAGGFDEDGTRYSPLVGQNLAKLYQTTYLQKLFASGTVRASTATYATALAAM